MNRKEIKRLIANPGERIYYSHCYVIYNELGAIAFVWANCEQDAIDTAADSGHMDCQLMADSDYLEWRDKGWDDSYILAGNASEAYWSDYLGISLIKSR